MKNRTIKWLPSRRRLLLWAVVLAALPTAYVLWSPGWTVRDGRHDRGTNALWLQHGWLAGDAWLARNHKSPADFREPAQLAQLAQTLLSHHIRYAFPHLCPSSADGDIAPSDSAQVERLLDAMQPAGILVLPWVGGVRGKSAQPARPEWRQRFAASCATLLTDHPRLAGIHVNIEPMPTGDRDFLLLLDELRRTLPKDKRLSVAAYPPPTYWQKVPEVHWDEAYSRHVAARVDQAVIMLYDTSLHSPKLYEQLLKSWTRETLAWYAPNEVLLGVPAYDDTGVPYHDPAAENLTHALRGLHAGLGPTPPVNYSGISIYCEWQLTPEKWQILETQFLKPLK
jgi:hypothetical protein